MTVFWDSAEVDAKVRAAATRGVIAGAELVLATGNELIMSPPKTGRIYDRAGGKHQASAPGEAPANDLGALVGTSRSVLLPPAPTEISALANWSTNYAEYLEKGTHKMEPRPYARPALDLTAQAVRTGIQAEIGAAFK